MGKRGAEGVEKAEDNGGQIGVGDNVVNDKYQYGEGQPTHWRPLQLGWNS